MCGIAGFIRLRSGPGHDDCVEVSRSMARAISHRGPDGEGVWSDKDRGIYLAHRRLAIIDPSADGSQPMVSSDGRHVITYNGEIYNYRDLRSELESLGMKFRGRSDTEVLVNSIQVFGIRRTLEKAFGMFAFAVWNRETGTLALARDRLGEKPLYYGWVGESFGFSSELKALRKLPGFRNAVAPASVASFMRLSYVPSPHSIYEDIYKLPPGTVLAMNVRDLAETRYQARSDQGVLSQLETYWNARERSEVLHEKSGIGEGQAIEELDAALQKAVKRQLVSDVPIGAMLSGGIDSTTIVSIMQSLSGRPIKTFTIGFHEQGYNEATYAKRIAGYLGTDHTELYLTGDDALSVVPRLPSLYDEPFSDSSQIPTYLVAKLARTKVTVALSGDGGDELFGGYTRYLWAEDVWRSMNRLPGPVRSGLAGFLSSISPDIWQRIYDVMERFLPGRYRQRNAGEKVHTLARLLRESKKEEIYLHMLSHWTPHDQIVPGVRDHVVPYNDDSYVPAFEDFRSRMMLFDLVSYLPDDILAKLDRASMGVSLESRVPFLDPVVVELAFSLPLDYKIRGKEGKWILRKVLERYVPRRFFERPKMGFGVPVAEWLTGPLREWADDMLDPGLVTRHGLLNPTTITRRWESHLNGRGNWQYHLWDVLMFQSWMVEQEQQV